MTVNSYLNDLARRLIVRDSEKDCIRRSFIVLESRLSNYFLALATRPVLRRRDAPRVLWRCLLM